MSVQANGAPQASVTYRYVVVWMLAIVYALNFLDRQLVSILAEPIRKELNLTDTQLGIMGGLAFAVFYSTFGLPIAWLADRARRVWIISASCALWSLFTALCGTATSFVHMALFRMGVGVGEAGGSPPSYSIIADYFPPEKRGTGLAIYSLGVPIGSMIGAFAAGRVAEAFGWRAAFFALGVPGMLIALLVLFIVREPVRGGLDAKVGGAEHEPSPPFFAALAGFFKHRTLVLISIAGGMTTFVGYGAMSWYPAYLMRVKGMSLGDVATYYGLILGVTGIIGTFASGWLVDRLARRDKRWFAWLPALSMALTIPFAAAFVAAPTWPLALLAAALPMMMGNMFLAPALALVQNTVSPARRTISSAMLLFLLNMGGVGLGPVYMGRVSDWAKPHYGDHSLTVAYISQLPIYALVACAYLVVAASIKRDIQRQGASAK